MTHVAADSSGVRAAPSPETHGTGLAARREGFGALDPCVHCGFCLQACPTYLATGDEADSPRGRIVLMRALERGELDPHDAALRQHLDACLGCRGCEPVCPSGVGYGRGLEAAREVLTHVHGLPPAARAILGVFASESLWRPLFAAARLLRATGLPRHLAGRGPAGFAMAMLAATDEWRAAQRGAVTLRARERPKGAETTRASDAIGDPNGSGPSGPPERAQGDTGPDPVVRPTVALFRGCVMDALFGHVHDATRRTLEANGYQVVEVPGQVCCGALHEHAGERGAARALAARNVAALAGAADYVVVNSAGCGALLKDYGHLLGGEDAAALAGSVRDVSELLAEAGPRPGGPLELDVAYDAPCHLQHAQRVHAAPMAVLGTIRGLRLRLLPGYDRCCGSAGVYSLLQPEMSRAVLEDKIHAIAAADPRPDVVATGNPGCLMQIGAGLRVAGLEVAVAHPVELLDRAYAAAGYYSPQACAPASSSTSTASS
jgi:glycolate oxidase iron-sulfur subunit